MLTLATMRSLVRTLTATTATDILTDSLLNQMLNEALYEIYRRQGTGWPFSQTALTSDSSTPPFDAQFHMTLVYRTAAKVLQFMADTTPRAEIFMNEYNSLIADLEKFYLSKLANPDLYSRIQGVTSLGDAVRDITGVYDRQVMSTGMLIELINVAYTELLNYRDWKNWTAYYEFPLPAWGFAQEAIQAHSIPLDYTTQGTSEERVASPNAGSLIKEAHIFKGGPNPKRQRMVRLDSLADVDHNSPQIYYSVEYDHESGGIDMLIAPEQPTENTYVRIVSANKFPTRIDTWYDEEEEVQYYTFFEVPQQFNMMLVYRAAQLVLQQVAPDDRRIETYGNNFASLLDAFVSFDQLNHDTATFSLGEQGKEEARYIPWFRPA